MRDHHITRAHYEALERGELSVEGLQRHYREHLLEVCPVCDGELAAYMRQKRLAGLSASMLLLLLRRIEGDFGQLEEEAQRDLAELMELPPQRRRLRVSRARKRFRNPLLAELLIERSRERVFADPKESAELARLSFEVAIRQRIILPSGVDLSLEPMTRALAYEANGLRASGDPKSAEQPMSRALASLPKLAPTVRAEVLNLAASLRRDQRRFHEALTFIGFAIQLDEKAGDPHMVGEKLMVKAQILYDMGSPEEAIDTIKAALDLLDEHRDLRRYLAAEHALTCYLLDAGHPASARQRFDEALGLYARFEAEPMIQLRRRWLEGKIARGLGELTHAERCLLETRDEFLHLGNAYDAAVAALDLALLYEDQGRLDELQELADSLLPVFRAQDVHREALAALVLFVKAASGKAAKRPLIEALAEYLRQARRDRSLRFEPPAG